MQLLDGKKTSQDIQIELAELVKQKVSGGGKSPHLAAVLVGENGASLTYVNAKVKACDRVGFKSSLVKLSEKISEEDLLNEIYKLK
jgi:methylenetetrahydrofolate dehydrogenase (NADP+)/methenyltetrahydrofolate cyclohydrolase